MAYITVKQELSFEELKEQCWCGAIETLNRIEEEDKEDDLIAFLVDCFSSYNRIPTLTEINDLLRFEDEYVFEELGIDTRRKYTIEEIEANGYYEALEYALDYFIDNLDYPACKTFGKLQDWLYKNYGTGAQNWTAGAIKMITKEIKEQEILFWQDGEIVEE